MAIPAKNTLGNPNVTEGNFQVAIEQLRESVIGSGKAYDSANTYMQYDTCVYGGVTYYSKINSNTSNTPSIGTNWGDIADLISSVVHNTGNETIAGVKTLTGGLKLQNQNVSPFSGFKNYIINGKKTINQRGTTSTDNSYNHDRWYKAGNNWFQGIEGYNNLINGKTYTLSWSGVATASYYVGTDTSATINAQSFTSIANGGSFTLTISAGQNLWIKFSSDATGSTFNFVQLEEGSVATPFENIPYGLELSLCQRYYESSYSNGVTVGSASTLGAKYSITIGSATAQGFTFIEPKRVPPTVAIYSPSGTAGYVWNNADIDNGSATLHNIGTKGVRYLNNASNNWTANSSISYHYTASAEL